MAYCSFTGRDGVKHKLTPKQKLFCDTYLRLLGNGSEAAIEAGYKAKNRNVAKSIASENLTKPDLIEYLQMELEDIGFTDENVKKQHLFLLNQFGDLPTKARAIDMYYKAKGLYSAQKHELEQKVTTVQIVHYGDIKDKDDEALFEP